jgi:hypothetical protein
MATVKDITSMCKAGAIQDAYKQAILDYTSSPSNVWAQREVGWALYYLIKADADNGDYANLLKHLDELKSLDLLNAVTDGLIFDNIVFKVSSFIKNRIFPSALDSSAKLSAIFSKIKEYSFNPSKGYSFLLQTVIKFENWPELANFFDWWNLDKLADDDYTPFVNAHGQKMMTVAERAFISNSKVLLRINDLGRIEEFLPKLDDLMEKHPEMIYPGYFYGKLLIALGSDTQNELKVVLPFARKKSTEFWVWELLSTIYQNDTNKQLACLLRAVSCKTKEMFLGKVRVKLAKLYIQLNMLDRAKYHIDTITRCYVAEGWRIPQEVISWAHESWISTTIANDTAPIDYVAITNTLLCEGTQESIAVVSYIDNKSNRVSIIYGRQQKANVKIRFKVGIGTVLKINYIKEADGHILVLNAIRVQMPANLQYAKFVNGTIIKSKDKDYAFLKSVEGNCFISANCAKKYSIKNGEQLKGLIAIDYDTKKKTWNWVCLSIKR